MYFVYEIYIHKEKSSFFHGIEVEAIMSTFSGALVPSIMERDFISVKDLQETFLKKIYIEYHLEYRGQKTIHTKVFQVILGTKVHGSHRIPFRLLNKEAVCVMPPLQATYLYASDS